MTDVEYENTLFEVSEILRILDNSLVKKIPEKIKQEIETNKAQNYNFVYDLSKGLDEQKMLKTTEKYLTMLFLRYLCTEEEKTEVLEAMNNNEKSYLSEMREKYNPDKIFEDKKQIISNVEEQKNNYENVQMTVYKENIFSKILKIVKICFLNNKILFIIPDFP